MSIKLNLFLLVICVFVFETACSQSVKQLDEKNGFKNFIFGDPPSKYDGQIEQKYEGSGFYMHTGEVPSELFGWSWEHLFLSFSNDKLVSIEILWIDDLPTFENIKYDLSEIFGNPTSVPIMAGSHLEKDFKWEGDSVHMHLRRSDKNSPMSFSFSCPECKISLKITSEAIKQLNLESEF